jgi:hypothetical protein
VDPNGSAALADPFAALKLRFGEPVRALDHCIDRRRRAEAATKLKSHAMIAVQLKNFSCAAQIMVDFPHLDELICELGTCSGPT